MPVPAAEAAATVPPNTQTLTNSDIRIAVCFFRAARMSYSPVTGRPDRLCIFPYRARLIVGLARFPTFCPLRQFRFRQRHLDRALGGIDRDDVAILQQPD